MVLSLVFRVFVLATPFGVHLWCLVPVFLQCPSDKQLAVQLAVSGHRATLMLWLWVMKASWTFLEFSSKLWPLHICTWAAKQGRGHSVTSSSGQHGAGRQTQASPGSRPAWYQRPRGLCESCVNVSQGASSFSFFFFLNLLIFLYDYECSTCTHVCILYACMYVDLLKLGLQVVVNHHAGAGN